MITAWGTPTYLDEEFELSGELYAKSYLVLNKPGNSLRSELCSVIVSRYGSKARSNFLYHT